MTARAVTHTARQLTTPIALLSETWRYRWLALYFGIEYVRMRYRGTWIGWWWIPLRPAIEMGSRALLFGGLLGVSSGDRPYLIFFSVGTAAWLVFDRVGFFAMRSLQMNRRMSRSAYIPRLAVVTGSVLPGAVEAALYFAIAGLVGLYFRIERGSFYLYLDRHLWIVAAGLLLLAAYGVLFGMLTAPMVVYARDVRYLARYFTGAVYVFTPVIYPLALLPPAFRSIATYNPLSAPVEMVKYGLLQTAPPRWGAVMSSALILAISFLVMLFVFARSARRAAAAV